MSDFPYLLRSTYRRRGGAEPLIAVRGRTSRGMSELGHKRSLVGQGDRNMLLGIFAHVGAVPLNYGRPSLAKQPTLFVHAAPY